MNSTTGAIIIEGHVQGLSNTRSLGEAGIPVIVVDKHKCIARHSKYCYKFFRCPDYLSQEFVEFLTTLAVNENLTGWVLIPSNDHAVLTISKNRNSLEKFYHVITPHIDIIGNIYDKSRLLQVAEKLGIPIPVTQYFIDGNEPINKNLTYPLLTKGRNGLSFYKATGRTAFLANSAAELRHQLTEIARKVNLSETFTQEVIPFDGTNKTISFTAFCDQGEIKTHWMGVKLREHPLQFGTATFAESVNIGECYAQSIPLLQALKYTGVCEVEYLFDPRTQQYKLIEINARTWLWVGLARACGVDFVKIIYEYMNQQVMNYPETYSTGKYWINPISDTVFAVLGMLQGKINPIIYFTSLLKGNKVNALFIRGDLKPGFAYLFSMLSLLSTR
jgi:predicted ATP-grasp superfamily ATP-dependent carboligase